MNIGSRQAGRDRGSNVVAAEASGGAMRTGIEAVCGQARPARDLLYGDGKAASRIAEVLAHAPLGIEKTLTF